MGCQHQEYRRQRTHSLQSFQEIRDGERALRRIRDIAADAVWPPADGLIHELMKLDAKCVVKSLIPAAEGIPHRTNENNGQYYRRRADRTNVMEAYEIAEMFGRRGRPVLTPSFSDPSLIPAQRKPQTSRLETVLTIENTGRRIARFPMITITFDPHEVALEVTFLNQQLSDLRLEHRRNEGVEGRIRLLGGADSALFPMCPSKVSRLLFLDRPQHRTFATDVKIVVEIVAEDVLPTQSPFCFSELKLNNAVNFGQL